MALTSRQIQVGTKHARVTQPIDDGDMPIPRMSYAERQIIAMLEAGVDALTVCRAIRAGNHLHWRPDVAAEEAA